MDVWTCVRAGPSRRSRRHQAVSRAIAERVESSKPQEGSLDVRARAQLTSCSQFSSWPMDRPCHAGDGRPPGNHHPEHRPLSCPTSDLPQHDSVRLHLEPFAVHRTHCGDRILAGAARAGEGTEAGFPVDDRVLVPLGCGLDFFFAHRFFIFPNPGATLKIEAPAVGRPVPIEEYVFYLTGFIAVLLIYVWMDEFWLAAYNVPDYRGESKLIPRLLQFHPTSAILGVVLIAAAVVYKKKFSATPEGSQGISPSSCSAVWSRPPAFSQQPAASSTGAPSA